MHRTPPATIKTERLDLVPLSHEQLQCYLDDPTALGAELGVPVSRTILTERVRGAITKKLARMAAADAGVHAWYTYWLVVVREVPGCTGGFGAGLLGFKGAPGEDGEVEIGYGIDPAYQGQGCTTEAARALIGWAFQDPACRAVMAPGTMKTNVASNRVLQKLGMRLVAQGDEANDWRLERAEWTP